MSSSTNKEAGVTVHLVEELSDARLRCDQLSAYLAEAARLIENSPYKDKIFEMAGHLIYAAPQTLLKVQKAVEAAAFAANRIDYEDLKNTLRPEKVQQLDQGLGGVRIRHIHRRSEPTMPITPKYVADKLRQFAAKTREDSLPGESVLQFVSELNSRKQASSKESFADILERYADVAEGGNRNYGQLAASLRRMVGDNYVREYSCRKASSDFSWEVTATDEDKQSRFEEGKPADPTQNMSPEDKKKWEDNKDKYKDKFKAASSAWKADSAK